MIVRTIDRPEEDEDEGDGGEEERGVEVGEDLLGIRREAEVAAEDDLHPVGVVAGQVADVLTPVGCLVEVRRDGENRVVGQLRAQRHQRGEDDDPDPDHDPLSAAAGGDRGEPPHRPDTLAIVAPGRWSGM
jgi:hypothetical protein